MKVILLIVMVAAVLKLDKWIEGKLNIHEESFIGLLKTAGLCIGLAYLYAYICRKGGWI